MNKSFTILFFLLLFSNLSFSQLYINEWMTSNSSTINDPDFDNSGDWIEIFNDFNDTLDLSGFYLTDDLSEPMKWTFPADTKMPPNDFLLIWADGEDVGLHTSFKLTREGESIGLYNANGEILDSIIYNTQKTDVSMGRVVDGSFSLGFFLEPTPGTSNNTQALDGITFYEPHFSIRGGFYDSPIEVVLSSIGGTIRYTLDGSVPTLSSTEYTNPISISETTNLRASVFQPNFIPGKTVTHTYFFNENFKERGLPVFSISSNPEYFWDSEIGLYVQDFKPEWEYPVNIELFENDGGNRAVLNELVGTKVNGLNSWQLPQKMLGIYFDNEYDRNNLDYPLFFDRDRRRFDSFILRASGSDWAFTLFRDGLCQGLTSETMDIEKAGFRPSIVYINGEYMGIHNIRSRVNESFIEDNFGYGNNEYDLIENNGEVEEGDTEAFNELFALFNTDLSNDTSFQEVANQLDIRNFTDFFITEIWTSNSSWGHNIQMWKPKQAGTKWRFILQDFDRGFSGSDNNGIDYFTTDNSPNGYNWARASLNGMLQNEAYASQFASRFADHLYTTFHPDRVTGVILNHKAAIQNEIPFHVDKWAGTTSDYGDGISNVGFWENEVQKLITFARERQTYMIDDLRDHFPLEEAANLAVMSYPAQAGIVKINEIKIPESSWNGPYFKDLPFELTAEAGVGHEFQGWSSAVFETIIEKGSEWKYLDDGSDQGSEWQNLDFNDSAWASGLAEFGYGDGDEVTEVSFGGDSGNKYPTTYFRKTFTIENVNEFPGQIAINMIRDDGAIVYLNGKEIIRSNMPDGTITFDSHAIDFVASPAEHTFQSFFLSTDLLIEGENIIAVEIHQANATSSDISFDLELKALKLGQIDIFSTENILPVNLTSDTILVANFLQSNNCILPRTISENTTLTIDCSPYLAPSDVTLMDSISLIVEPGVEIHFPEDANFFVHGHLQVDGNEMAPVIFKAQEGVEKWGSLIFKFASDTASLNWLEIIDASKGPHPIAENAAISAFHAKVEMDHLTIENVHGNPIFTQYSDVFLTNSQLHSKITGDLINVKYGYGFIDNCSFRGNSQVDTDAIDYDEVINGVIRNSKIHDFHGFNSDGIDLGEESEDVLIENNFIYNCTDKGISVGQFSTIFALNNTIVNCNQGFGIKDLGTAEIDQTTFYNNAIPVACFEKNVGGGGGIAFVTNSIFSNSPVAPFLVDEHSILNISSSLSDTEFIPDDNLFNHPHFENPTQNNFNLKPESFAIDAGMDDLGNTIDLGTKSHQYSAPATVIISAINYHPEDEEEAEYLHLYNPHWEPIDLTGYIFSEAFDFIFPSTQIAPGETIWMVKDASLFPDVSEQIFTWSEGKLSNGGENIRLTSPSGIIVDQVIYDDEIPWPIEADGQGGWLTLIGPDLDNHFSESWQVEGITDTEELTNFDHTLQIFPNPADNWLNIASEELLIESLSIFNALGQEVRKYDFSPTKTVNIDVSNLTNGVWFLKLNNRGLAKKIKINRD